jgi:hypothetical protein
MSTPPAEIPEADWLATPASVGTLFLVQQQEIRAFRQENDELLSQLTGLATELAQRWERIGRSSRYPTNPQVMALALSRRSVARAAAASAAVSRAIPGWGRSCCRERIQRPCAIR